MREAVIRWIFRSVLMLLVGLICLVLLAFVVAAPAAARLPIAGWAIFIAGCEIAVIVITWKI